MTDKPTPTDAELKALLLDKLPASKHYIRPVIEKMVAAMQAAIDKWGQPAQFVVGGKPVYQASYKGGFWQDSSRERHEYLKTPGGSLATDWELRVLYTAPQPVAREPLPKFLALKFHARRDKKATVTLLFPGHEAADAWVRGIKGGQHVE